MSCSVGFVPFSLIALVYELVETGITMHNNNLENKHDYHAEIPVEHFIEKDFETVFMDKALLLKTLEEHGVTDIKETENGVNGNIDDFNLSFTKSSESSPYSLHIVCREHDNVQEKFNDLNCEYALNVQEETYLNLISKLKNNNMEIETEEVLEDNTIVLTINLE